MEIKYVGPYSEENKIKFLESLPNLPNIGGIPNLPKEGHMGKDLYNYLKNNALNTKGRKPGSGLTNEELLYRIKNKSLMYEDPKPTVAEIPLKNLKGLDKYSGSINKTKQIIPQGAKDIQDELAKKYIQKKTQTWDQTGKLAMELMNDSKRQIKVLEKANAGEAWTAVEAETARRINVNAITKLHELANSNITEAQKTKLFNSFVDGVLKPVSKGSSESGRALNIFRKELSYTRLSKNISKLGRELKPHEWAEFKRINMDNPFEVKRFADKLRDPKLSDYIYEYWYNSILSGVPTHVVNVASNTLWGAFQVPHRVISSGVDKVITSFSGAQRSRFLNETIPMMAGMKSGFKRGIKAAKDVFTKGELSEFETKWAQEVGSAQGAFERSPHEILRKVGKVLTVPTKALRSMDVLANSIAYDSELGALARRTSNLKGLSKPGRRAIEQKFVKNPPEWAHKKAMEYAQYATFMSEPGKISQSIMGLRDAVPGGRLIIPFVNTIGNLLKRGVEMTPGVGLALAKGQNTSDVVAKQIEGLMLTYFVWNKMENGEITTSAPDTEAKRERFYAQGKQPWAIKMGDTYYQYRRIEPFNTIITAAALSHDAYNKAKTEEEKTKIIFDAAGEFKNNLIDSSYLQGVSQVLNRHGKLDRALPQTVTSFVPFSGFWRSINRAYEAATTGSAKVRDTQNWLAALGQVIPGLSANTPPKLNVWGEEIELQGGVLRQWLPYKWSKETDDPVENELKRLDIYPSLPSQTLTIRGEKQKIKDDVYRDYAISFGKDAKSLIQQEISGPYYNLLDDDKKKKRLDGRIESLRAKKRNQLKKRIAQDDLNIKYVGSYE